MLMTNFLSAAQQAHAALTAWDQAAGDGDFGDNLCVALGGTSARVADGSSLADELAVAAEWFLDHVGGSSGPLFGLLFNAMAKQTRQVADMDQGLVNGLADGTAAIQRVGEAALGDRTMLDALIPTIDHIRGLCTPVNWTDAARVALRSARDTAHMRARMGRASYLGDRAIGSPDAGAMGIALLFWALAAERDPASRSILPSPASIHEAP
jgi:phosphoenolpyruvate---glycerone phosphotransferase subunit DhaL